MDLDPVLLSRIQFAFVVSFHIIFPTFTIGLAAWLATLEGLSLFTRRAVYGRVTEPWTARKAEPPPQTAGVRVPRSNGCTVAGGEMRCRR